MIQLLKKNYVVIQLKMIIIKDGNNAMLIFKYIIAYVLTVGSFLIENGFDTVSCRKLRTATLA